MVFIGAASFSLSIRIISSISSMLIMQFSPLPKRDSLILPTCRLHFYFVSSSIGTHHAEISFSNPIINNFYTKKS